MVGKRKIAAAPFSRYDESINKEEECPVKIRKWTAAAMAVALAAVNLALPSSGQAVKAAAGPGAPALYLPFDKDTADLSGNGIAVTGSGAGYEDGMYDSALRFSGGATLKVDPSFKLGEGDFTISFWIKDYASALYTYVLGNQDYGQGEHTQGVGVLFGNSVVSPYPRGNMYLVMGNGSPYLKTAPAYELTDSLGASKWVHMIYVADRANGQVKTYVNGKLADTKKGVLQSPDSSNPLCIGGSPTWTESSSDFALDELKIFRTALSDQEAADEAGQMPTDWELSLNFNNGSATDQSGNGYDFVSSGSEAAQYPGGHSGKGLRLTGKSYLTCSKPLSLGTDDYTLSFWYKDEGQQTYAYVLGNQDYYNVGERDRGFGIMYSDVNNMYLAMGDGSAPFGKTNASPSIQGEWVHVAYCVDRDLEVRVYQNGALLYTAPLSPDTAGISLDSSVPFQIGAGSLPYVDNHFMMDDLRIYRRALSGKEVKAMAVYEEGQSPDAGNISFEQQSGQVDEMRSFLLSVASDLDNPNFSAISWASSDPQTVYVQDYENNRGVASVHGLKPGTAVVSAVDNATGSRAQMTVTVNPVTVDMNSLKVFFGDLHAHTGVSDGAGDSGTDSWYESRGVDTFWDKANGRSKPEDAFRHAAENGKADFLVVTDHHYGPSGGGKLTTQDYEDALASAKKYTSDKFLAMVGYEASGYFGHINTFNGTYDQMFTLPTGAAQSLDHYATEPGVWQDLEKFYQTLTESKTLLAQWNHPTDLWNNVWDFNDFGFYSKELDQVINNLEIINYLSIQDTKVGHFEKSYIKALDAGWHVSPTGNSDWHQGNWTTAYETRTAVVTDELTETKIYDAMRKRRTYATDDNNLLIDYRVNGEILGSELDGSTNTFHFQIQVSDPDTTVPEDKIKTIEVVSDGGQVVKTIDVNGYSADVSFTLKSKTARYFYVRVKDSAQKIANADYVAYTAPIWTGLDSGKIVGDVNGDGVANAQDVIQMKRAILAKEEYAPVSDLNRDGSVNILDIIELRRLIAGL